MATEIEIKILEDGTIKITTGKVAATVHASADAFLDLVSELAGGEVKKTPHKHGHAAAHEHKKAEAK